MTTPAKKDDAVPTETTPRPEPAAEESYVVPEITTGVPKQTSNPYQAPVSTVSYGFDEKYLTDEMKNVIIPMLNKYGINMRITSNIRPVAKAPNGNTSYHNDGLAFDVQPISGVDINDFKNLYASLESSGALKALNDLGYHVYYEDKSINPHATGPHFHVGKDISQNIFNPNRITIPVSKGREGLKFPETGVADSRNFFQRLFNTHPFPTSGPVDLDEVSRRQAWAESNNNPKAVNSIGAVGTYQVTPVVKREFVKRTGLKGKLTDPEYNKQVRDWYFNERIPEHYFVDAGEPTDSVRVGKQLAAYNAGPTNVMNRLAKAKRNGVDIYKTFDWLPYMPKETRNYVDFILRNKDTGGNRTNKAYKKHMK